MSDTIDCFHLGVKGLVRNTEGKLLLMKANPKKLHQCEDAFWDIPGGRVHRGEAHIDTLKRELHEETGINDKFLNIQPLAMVLSNIRIKKIDSLDVGLIYSIYLCDIGPAISVQMSDEHTDFGWFTPQEAANHLKNLYPRELTEILFHMQ